MDDEVIDEFLGALSGEKAHIFIGDEAAGGHDDDDEAAVARDPLSQWYADPEPWSQTKAEEAMERVAKPEVTPEVALISACEKGHKVEEALELVEEMQWRGLEPNVSACEEGHKAETAIEVFAEMQQNRSLAGGSLHRDSDGPELPRGCLPGRCCHCRGGPGSGYLVGS